MLCFYLPHFTCVPHQKMSSPDICNVKNSGPFSRRITVGQVTFASNVRDYVGIQIEVSESEDVRIS